MKTKSDPFRQQDEIQWEICGKGLRRQILGYGSGVMTVKVEFESGGDGGLHSHPHAQTGYIAAGKFSVMIDGQTRILSAGDGFFVAPNVMHHVKCVEKGVAVDNFSPVREDFLGE